MRTYAIGDIHGHLDLLKAAHARIAADRERVGDSDAPVVHLGDLVDRGPDSAGVIDYLSQGIARGENWLVLRGNHDRMFAGFLGDATYHDPRLRPDYDWTHPRVGGIETLESYGIVDPGGRPPAQVQAETVAAVPASHRALLQGMLNSYRRGEVLFVHAGIRPGVALEEQTEDDLIWIRGEFHQDTRDHGVLVIHGHTPVEKPTHFGNRVDIDSGAAYGGPLTAIVVEDREVFVLTDAGRAPLLP
ncbi:metallophosphoesterase family protein [Acidimangrovimonas pyrenivorans]|uniref:Metallophosphoesterase family protein n=1 Tax=Acidimangrovimonas pyrenivorans TaxID=2030798 RepID=A0ABV7ALL4_9RHOB